MVRPCLFFFSFQALTTGFFTRPLSLGHLGGNFVDPMRPECHDGSQMRTLPRIAQSPFETLESINATRCLSWIFPSGAGEPAWPPRMTTSVSPPPLRTT